MLFLQNIYPCKDGKCVCAIGFSGIDCSLDENNFIGNTWHYLAKNDDLQNFHGRTGEMLKTTCVLKNGRLNQQIPKYLLRYFTFDEIFKDYLLLEDC